MQTILKFILSISFLLTMTICQADMADNQWFTKTGNTVKLRVDLFLSSTCTHCHNASEFFKQLEPKMPWLEVHRYIINQDKSALEFFRQRLVEQQTDEYAVPAIFFCGSRWVGFADAASTGKELLRGLDYCRRQILKSGSLSPATGRVLDQWAEASWFRASISEKPPAAAFVPMMALTDALNPCAVFCFLTLFAFLFLYKHRSIKVNITILFLMAMGLVHFIEQTYMLFFYQMMYWLRLPALLIGLSLLAYTVKIYRQNKEDLYAVPNYVTYILVILTAIVIQTYQQTCTPNFALVFEQWLSSQQISTGTYILYQSIYQLVYLVPLAVVAAIYIALISPQHSNKHYYKWRSLGCFILAMVALLLIIYPYWLSKLLLSLLVLILALLMSLVTIRRNLNKNKV